MAEVFWLAILGLFLVGCIIAWFLITVESEDESEDIYGDIGYTWVTPRQEMKNEKGNEGQPLVLDRKS